jgi:hypothetical protein
MKVKQETALQKVAQRIRKGKPDPRRPIRCGTAEVMQPVAEPRNRQTFTISSTTLCMMMNALTVMIRQSDLTETTEAQENDSAIISSHPFASTG